MRQTFYNAIGYIGLASCISFITACGSSDDDSILEAPKNAGQLDVVLTPDSSPIEIDSDLSFTYYANEPYGDDDRNVLDIYLPASNEPTALVIYVHGGGFFAGDKAAAYNSPDDINAFLSSNVAFASINYRLLEVPGFTPGYNNDGISPNDSEGISKPLSDVKKALQYLRYNAKNFNIDPDRIAMYGVSAGAISSLWLAYSDDMADLSSEDPIDRQSTRLSAAGAIESQGSLDLVRWESDILTSLGFTLETGLTLGAGSLMESFYGLPSDAGNTYANTITAIRSTEGELAVLRSSLDIPALIDSTDSPVYLNSSYVSIAETLSDLSCLGAMGALGAAQAAYESAALEEQVSAGIALNNALETAVTSCGLTSVNELVGVDFALLSDKLINAILHYPTHALVVHDAANNAGAIVESHIPELEIVSSMSVSEFILSYLD